MSRLEERSDLKYTIEDVHGLPILMRYMEPSSRPAPTNAEFEFWQEILRLRERVKELEGLLSSGQVMGGR